MITYETGTFLVDSSGEITVDYLFDGGWFQGQLGVFSLEGMDLLEPGSAEFMRAAARRASSSSDRGHVIIDDATEGARFEADLGYERNFNRHEYLDVKSFAMTPGEEVGFVMVQNTSFEETLENPEAIGEFGKSVLYSIPEANKTDSISQQVQFTSVANNGTIALEDYPTRGTKQDFNDVVYQVTGFAEGNLPELENHLDPQLDWVQTEVGTELLTYADSSFGNGDDNIENVENETSDEPEEASQSELTGVFEVGEIGEVTVDYLFDGGFLSGEVGIFSLEDLNLENIGSNGFNREIINRVTSNSAQGHIVMTDASQGAGFEGDLDWEPNFNQGEYAGKQTFMMDAEATFGLVLVPDGSFEELTAQRSVSGDLYFSVPEANPNGQSQTAEVSTTGENTIISFEDTFSGIQSSSDYNDVVLALEGAQPIGLSAIADVIADDRNWLDTAVGEDILSSLDAAQI